MSASDNIASRVTAGIRAGHRFAADLSYDPHRCGCESCLRGDAIMAELSQPATRAAPERLLALAREYREQLMVTFDAACRRRSEQDGERARGICSRLADEARAQTGGSGPPYGGGRLRRSQMSGPD